MSRPTVRDYSIIATFVGASGVVIILALASKVGWALASLGALAGVIGIVNRLQFVSRRPQLQEQAKRSRRTLAAAERAEAATKRLAGETQAARSEVVELRGEVRALRDALAAKSEHPQHVVAHASIPGSGAEPLSRPIATGQGRKAVGLVGFFGHGNYGDELFIDVFEQFLGKNFDLRIIPDLQSKPYFSRPVEEKVAEVDAIVMGGGDLIQRWNTDPRYFDRTYLRKPFFAAGVGVPVYGDSEKHQEKPHIMARLKRFFGDPNVRMIGMRDDFGANWVRSKLEPNAPVFSEPDIVCSLDLPAVTKPSGAPILGIVTRQRRVETPDNYSRLEELAEHAKSCGFRIRQIILGTGSVGERDLANAPALKVQDKEVVYSESLDDLTRAIGECTVLASMKFHGTVVATMYGVPSIVLVPTNKNRNFMERIGRSDLVASHNSDKLIHIFGDAGPEPIDSEKVAMLRSRSTAFMEHLREQIVAEVAQ